MIYRPEQIARKMIARTYLALGDSTRALDELEAIVTWDRWSHPGASASIPTSPRSAATRGSNAWSPTVPCRVAQAVSAKPTQSTYGRGDAVFNQTGAMAFS